MPASAARCRAHRLALLLTAIPWAIFTFVVYAIILVGGFVKAMGRDHTPTLEHYLTGFRIEMTAARPVLLRIGLEFVLRHDRGRRHRGAAHRRDRPADRLAADAPALRGRRAFEFATMLSFAIPGTVIGVTYIVAFNVPPVEITGTALILVICFVFRNMPVGVRAGMATLSQIDKSLDEASLTLGAVRRDHAAVVLPLLRPAIVASLVYSFVRAMTAVSAVIFLVTAEVQHGDHLHRRPRRGRRVRLAIAYSSVLIVVMLSRSC